MRCEQPLLRFPKRTGLFFTYSRLQIYTHDDPQYTGRVSVPVLFDKKTNKIVNNESADIARMFNDAFDEIGATSDDFYPPDLRRLAESATRESARGRYARGRALTTWLVEGRRSTRSTLASPPP
jgi:hypothetical protein